MEAHLHARHPHRGQFVTVTDLSGHMLTFDGVWHFGEVFSSRMNPGFHCKGQMADSVYRVVWVSGLLMSTLWPMVAAGLWYGQACVMNKRTQVHCIDGILNAQRYRDEILRPIVVPFIDDHHFMLQHDNALPHVEMIYLWTLFERKTHGKWVQKQMCCVYKFVQ